MRQKTALFILLTFSSLAWGEGEQQALFSSYHSFNEMLTATNSILPPIQTLTTGPKFHWFGYYLHDQVDSSGRYLLAAEVDFEGRLPNSSDTIKVGMIDLQNSNNWIELGESGAWSWQQDCFLQWRPGSDTEVVWNDREGNTAVSRVYNISNQQIRTLPLAIDEVISPDGKLALCSDFSRTWQASPGYGYPGIDNPSTAVNSPQTTNASILLEMMIRYTTLREVRVRFVLQML